jgi:hypothetical protein
MRAFGHWATVSGLFTEQEVEDYSLSMAVGKRKLAFDWCNRIRELRARAGEIAGSLDWPAPGRSGSLLLSGDPCRFYAPSKSYRYPSANWGRARRPPLALPAFCLGVSGESTGPRLLERVGVQHRNLPARMRIDHGKQTRSPALFSTSLRSPGLACGLTKWSPRWLKPATSCQSAARLLRISCKNLSLASGGSAQGGVFFI